MIEDDKVFIPDTCSCGDLRTSGGIAWQGQTYWLCSACLRLVKVLWNEATGFVDLNGLMFSLPTTRMAKLMG